jgi:hypothetical protein
MCIEKNQSILVFRSALFTGGEFLQKKQIFPKKARIMFEHQDFICQKNNFIPLSQPY